MEGSIGLNEAERKVLLGAYSAGDDAHSARHAHILLLLDDGHSYRTIRGFLYASYDLIATTVRRYHEGGVDASVGQSRESEAPVPFWLLRIVHWFRSGL